MFFSAKRRMQHWSAAFTVAAFLAFAALIALEPAAYVNAQRSSKTVQKRTSAARYSQFPHDIKPHQKECGSCHTFPSENWKTVRPAADAIPDITEYPRHESCLDCHKPQFFRGARPPICSICHVNPSPRDSRRHPFPNPREAFDLSPKGKTAVSDFEIRFPHASHIEIVSAVSRPARFIRASFSRAVRAEESCAVCHKTIDPQGDGKDENATKPPAGLGEAFWLKKGTFKSSPTGHTTCFTCHSADSGIAPAPTACASCHVLRQPAAAADLDPRMISQMGVTSKIIADAWRRRDSSGTFRHEFFAHNDLACSTCHAVETMNTLDAASKRVRISNCAACHITATVDDGGALNFESDARAKNPAFQCTKCHLVFGSKPIPLSHTTALKEAGAKP